MDIDEYQQVLPNDGDSHRNLDYQTFQSRLTLVNDFVGYCLPDLVNDGEIDEKLTSWSDKMFEVDLAKEPAPLTFEEKNHLAQHAIALKLRVHSLIDEDNVLEPEQTHYYSRDIMGPSGPNVGLHALRKKDKSVIFSPKLVVGHPDQFMDRWEFGVLRLIRAIDTLGRSIIGTRSLMF
jgi:hypothetical protein